MLALILPCRVTAVVFGGNANGQFSWIEYQALMLALAGLIIVSLFLIEMALNRFQVLPLLFPGMFRVQERRFFFFNFDISDGQLGKSIRAEAKMVVRLTICLVLSYLWQHCVLETSQQVGTDFPKDACGKGADCFASRVHIATFFSREYDAIDCETPKDFEKRMVISCIRFVPPTATTWLMHLAISYSITQLNYKAFELLVWIAGNSKWSRRIIGGLIFITFSMFVGLFFGGVLTEFVSSWLSFVMSLTIPMFLHTVYKNSRSLEKLWKDEAVKVQLQLEAHLSGAFADIETAVNLDPSRSGGHRVSGSEREQSNRDGLATIKARENEKQPKVMSTLKKMQAKLPSLRNSLSLRNRGAFSSDGSSSEPTSPKQVYRPVEPADPAGCDSGSGLSAGLAEALDSAAREGSAAAPSEAARPHADQT